MNDEKKALGLSAGSSILFYVFDLAGKMSEKVEWLRNTTVYSLYKPQEIATGSIEILGTSLILFSLGNVLFTSAIIVFQKRDLPL